MCKETIDWLSNIHPKMKILSFTQNCMLIYFLSKASVSQKKESRTGLQVVKIIIIIVIIIKNDDSILIFVCNINLTLEALKYYN